MTADFDEAKRSGLPVCASCGRAIPVGKSVVTVQAGTMTEITADAQIVMMTTTIATIYHTACSSGWPRMNYPVTGAVPIFPDLSSEKGRDGLLRPTKKTPR